MSDALFCVNGERLFRGLVSQVIAPRFLKFLVSWWVFEPIVTIVIQHLLDFQAWILILLTLIW